jgi:hypothetical protein
MPGKPACEFPILHLFFAFLREIGFSISPTRKMSKCGHFVGCPVHYFIDCVNCAYPFRIFVYFGFMIWRKPAFVLFLTCLLETGHAQIPKNTIMAGGSIGFQYTTDHQDYVNTATFKFSPLLGGFIAKNCVLGIAPILMYTASSGGYSYIDSSTNPPTPVKISISQHQTSLGLGPFVRYYIKVGPIVYVFVHASPSIMGTWTSLYSDPHQPTVRAISAAWVLGPGLSVNITKAVAIELSLYYQGMYHRSSQYINGNLLGNPGTPYIDNGMVFNVGFQVYLPEKKKDKDKEKKQ